MAVRLTAGVEPRRHQACGKVSECQHSARDTMVFIAGAAITYQHGDAVGSNAEFGSCPCTARWPRASSVESFTWANLFSNGRTGASFGFGIGRSVASSWVRGLGGQRSLLEFVDGTRVPAMKPSTLTVQRERWCGCQQRAVIERGRVKKTHGHAPKLERCTVALTWQASPGVVG